MTNIFSYKNYYGSIDIDAEDLSLSGKLLFIEDVVMYEAASMPELKAAFEESVDQYIEMCRELGWEPKSPCKGVFNVRIGAELHRKAAILAAKQGRNLNDFVKEAVAEKIDRLESNNQPVVETHHHYHMVPNYSLEPMEHTFGSSEQTQQWQVKLRKEQVKPH